MIRNLILFMCINSMLLISCKKEAEQSDSNTRRDTATVTTVFEETNKEPLSAEDILKEIIKSSTYYDGSDIKNDLRINVDPYHEKLLITVYQESTNENFETYFYYDLELKKLTMVDKEGKHKFDQDYERRYADKLLVNLGFDPVKNRRNCITDTIDIPLPTSSTTIENKTQKHRLKCAFNAFEQYRCGGDINYSTLPPRAGFNYALLTSNCGDSSFDDLFVIKDGWIIDKLTINASIETMENETLEMIFTECLISKDYTIYLKKYQTDKELKKFLSQETYKISPEGKFVKLNANLSPDSLNIEKVGNQDTIRN